MSLSPYAIATSIETIIGSALETADSTRSNNVPIQVIESLFELTKMLTSILDDKTSHVRTQHAFKSAQQNTKTKPHRVLSSSTTSQSDTSDDKMNVGHLFSLQEVLMNFNVLKSGTTIDGQWFGVNVKYTHKKTREPHSIIFRYCGRDGCRNRVITDESNSSFTCRRCNHGEDPYTPHEDNTFIPSPWKAVCVNGHFNHIDRSLLAIPFAVDVNCGCGSALTKIDNRRFNNVNTK